MRAQCGSIPDGSAWFNHLVDSSEALAVSAGTQPDDHVHPEVVTVMAEIGIDLSGATPRKLTEELARGATLLVTMGCGTHLLHTIVCYYVTLFNNFCLWSAGTPQRLAFLIICLPASR